MSSLSSPPTRAEQVWERWGRRPARRSRPRARTGGGLRRVRAVELEDEVRLFEGLVRDAPRTRSRCRRARGGRAASRAFRAASPRSPCTRGTRARSFASSTRGRSTTSDAVLRRDDVIPGVDDEVEGLGHVLVDLAVVRLGGPADLHEARLLGPAVRVERGGGLVLLERIRPDDELLDAVPSLGNADLDRHVVASSDRRDAVLLARDRHVEGDRLRVAHVAAEDAALPPRLGEGPRRRLEENSPTPPSARSGEESRREERARIDDAPEVEALRLAPPCARSPSRMSTGEVWPSPPVREVTRELHRARRARPRARGKPAPP